MRAILIAAAAVLIPSVAAAQVTVLSAGAVEPGLRAAAAAFQKATGQGVTVTFSTSPQVRTRLTAGESFDVVIAPPDVLDEFVKAGRLSQTTPLSPRFVWMASKETDPFITRPTTFIETEGTSVKAALDIFSQERERHRASCPTGTGV